ncbi:phage integrase SAM-like domain-containing protein, partial [Chishuiella sp.]|uniref:phage integrase SAM-like domain-containing protein n=1 Tax=Chishuiella sp. TaxID=1969467 RepID=UPI0028AEC412
MKADIILDTRRITKKGYPVKIRVHDVRLLKIQKTPHLYIKTNIYQNSQVLKMSPELKKRDFELSKQLDYCVSNNLTIEDSIEIIENGIPKTDLQKRYFELLAELNEIKGKINNTGIFEFFNIYKEEKIKRKENLNVHENTIKHFKIFLKESLDLDEIPLNEITYKVVNDYQIYLINKKLSGTTVNVYIEKLSNIFSESQKREELGIKDKSPFTQLKRVSTKDKIKNKDLSIENLIEFKNLNFSDWKRIKIEQYQFIQDLFLFQFAIGGHDLVDIALLKWDNIINNRIVFQRFKNNKLGNGGPVVNNFLSI